MTKRLSFSSFLFCLIFSCFVLASYPSLAKSPLESLTPAEKSGTDKVFNAKTFTLKNGMQVVVVPNDRVPVVTHMVWYRVGAADEPRGKSGIAHFLEHLMFKGHSYEGLGEVPSGEFSKIIRSLGGQDNAFTSQDYTAYYQNIASQHLETVMRMEAGRMRGLSASLEDVEAERSVILEERRQRIDNDPRAQFDEQMGEALYPNHPYSISIIGWFHEMETLSWDDAKAMYDQWYAPNNAILVVSGDVKVSDVKALAEKTYGIIPAAELPERKRTQSPPFRADTRVSMTHPVVKEPVYEIVFRVPSFRQSGAESLALQVLEEIMDGGSASRLYTSLVINKKMASSVSLSYSSFAWDDSTLSMSVIPREGYTLDQLEEEMDNALRDVIKKGVTETELKEAVTRMLADAVYAQDSVSGPAMVIGYSLVTGSSLDELEYWPHMIQKVTAEEIQAVATKYLNPDKPYEHPPVRGYLYPQTKKQASTETPAPKKANTK